MDGAGGGFHSTSGGCTKGVVRGGGGALYL